jgi:hypothetical protein
MICPLWVTWALHLAIYFVLSLRIRIMGVDAGCPIFFANACLHHKLCPFSPTVSQPWSTSRTQVRQPIDSVLNVTTHSVRRVTAYFMRSRCRGSADAWDHRCIELHNFHIMAWERRVETIKLPAKNPSKATVFVDGCTHSCSASLQMQAKSRSQNSAQVLTPMNTWLQIYRSPHNAATPRREH